MNDEMVCQLRRMSRAQQRERPDYYSRVAMSVCSLSDETRRKREVSPHELCEPNDHARADMGYRACKVYHHWILDLYSFIPCSDNQSNLFDSVYEDVRLCNMREQTPRLFLPHRGRKICMPICLVEWLVLRRDHKL